MYLNKILGCILIILLVALFFKVRREHFTVPDFVPTSLKDIQNHFNITDENLNSLVVRFKASTGPDDFISDPNSNEANFLAAVAMSASFDPLIKTDVERFLFENGISLGPQSGPSPEPTHQSVYTQIEGVGRKPANSFFGTIHNTISNDY